MQSLRTFLSGGWNALNRSFLPVHARQQAQPVLASTYNAQTLMSNNLDISELMHEGWHYGITRKSGNPEPVESHAHDAYARQRARDYKLQAHSPTAKPPGRDQLMPAGTQLVSAPIPIPPRTKPEKIFPAKIYGTMEARASLAKVWIKCRHSEPVQLRKEDFLGSEALKGCGVPCQSVL